LVKHKDKFTLPLEKSHIIATGQDHYNRALVNKHILVAVIEVTDGEEKNIAVLSKAICNGKVSWTQTQVIPLTTQEHEKKNGNLAEQSERQPLRFNITTVAAITGLSDATAAYFL
jgi:hypothetical protein